MWHLRRFKGLSAIVWKVFLISVYSALLLGGCSSNSAKYPEAANTTIPAGTKVDDLDLSGLPPADGQNKLKEWAKDKLEQNVSLVYNGTEIRIPLRELGAELDLAKTWSAVNSKSGQAVPSVLRVDGPKASQVLQEKLGKLTRPAQDATYKIENDKFKITPAVPGRAFASDAIVRELEAHPLTDVPNKITVPVVETPAAVTTESLKQLAFDAVIGEYTTKFAAEDENRSSNLTAAAKVLDQRIVKPGETFSFNGTIGPRTAETGYKDAYVIINNEYVQGTGGGICQVSTTLYNAVLLADLPVVERSPHAVAITYVPLGRDATVNYPNLDLKFKNDTSGLIYIRTIVGKGTLTIRLWGKKSDKTVRFENEVEKETDFQTEKRQDSSLPEGKIVQDQAGSKGYVVKTWRILKDSKGNETRQLLSRDEYAPANRILRVGTKG